MNKFRFTINVLAMALFTFAFASMAQAQATRTWVSGVGDDANPCSRTAPCKTFAGAISKTATDGEINALDSGGFGAVTIGKSITIEGGGQIAGVLVTLNGSGVIINAPTDAVVALRNLDFNGAGTGGNGVRIVQAKTVTVDHCQIYGFRGSPGRGISDERNTITPIPQLFVNDCYIRNNIGGVAAFSAGTNGPLRVTIDNSRIQGNTSTGVFGQNAAVIMVRFSNISGNLGDGVQINSTAQANLISCVLTENQGTAANNVSGNQLSLADTSIINNINGVSGTITSFGNNNVRNNAGGNTLSPPVGQQ